MEMEPQPVGGNKARRKQNKAFNIQPASEGLTLKALSN
jgi:hypothetical protein